MFVVANSNEVFIILETLEQSACIYDLAIFHVKCWGLQNIA